MCGRYALRTGDAALELLLGGEVSGEFAPRFNVAPTQRVPVVRAGRDGAPELASLRWGLVPSWSKSARGAYSMINARAESLASKPAFRSAYRRRRCLIPADGFYEWERVGGRKQPWFIALRDGAPFCFAGLWERWEGADGESVESCAIVTTAANALVAPLHDRMPAILPGPVYRRWLDPQLQDPAALDALLGPYPAGAMIAWPVSTHVNAARHDDPRCAQPIGEARGAD